MYVVYSYMFLVLCCHSGYGAEQGTNNTTPTMGTHPTRASSGRKRMMMRPMRTLKHKITLM